MPSDEALRRHWKRACWVLSVYEQCTQNNIRYPPLVGNGWNLNNSNLTILWDSEENMMNTRQTVALMRCGCRCKTSCQSSRCKCKRARNYCYGCKCVGCCNLPGPMNHTKNLKKMLMQQCWKFSVTMTFRVPLKSVTMTL